MEDAWHLEVQADDIVEIEENSSIINEQEPYVIDDESPVVVKKGDHLLELQQGHYVVIGAFSSFNNAEKYSDQVFNMGYKNSFGYASEKNLFYIYIFTGSSPEQARSKRDEFRKLKAFEKAWYLLVEE